AGPPEAPPEAAADGPAPAPAVAAAPRGVAAPGAAARGSASLRGSASSRGAALSEREREVAELLLLGLPYRDIGAQLFISAKTVEHHVARIRRRIGAGSRTEMMSMLRAMLAPTA
ncbi:MAG TPA: LuxR C-terminal-related transcriptional regulator, partial [Mycobacterium sp.]|nr:LuxR C-terminal-related transcriptional regulator [Mycobacterium sp.]